MSCTGRESWTGTLSGRTREVSAGPARAISQATTEAVMAMACWGSSERSRRENQTGELLPNPVSDTTTPFASFELDLQSGDDSTIAQATRPDTSDDGFSETVIP